MFTLRVGMAALALTFSAALAMAQTTTPPADTTTAEPKAMPPAATTTAEPKAMTPATEPKAMTSTDAEAGQTPPLPGANSFTESQARERMAEAGFMDVMELKKDDNGIWRGQAKKSGQDVGVALDYRGNIVQQ